MINEKEIEEMANISKIICNCIAECQQLKGYCGADDMAVYLYNADYRKQVWHKIADGDLLFK